MMTRNSVNFGEWFGKLRAIMELPAKLKETGPRWLCKCDCNNFAIVAEISLLSGRRNNCSCEGDAKPLVLIKPNTEYAYLTLISFTGRLDEEGDTLWLMKCVCEKYFDLPLRRLKNTPPTSCGCMRKKRKRMDLTGQIYPMFKVISYTGRDYLNNPLWLCECKCGRFFDAHTQEIRNGHTHSCGCHRKSLMTKNAEGSWLQENTNLHSFRIGKPSSRNTSGVTGVSFYKETGKWVAQMSFQGKRVLWKLCDSFDEAVDRRRKAEEQYVIPLLEKYNIEVKKCDIAV